MMIGVGVGIPVGVSVGCGVGVPVGVSVGCGVAVPVGDAEGETVGVPVGVPVGVGVALPLPKTPLTTTVASLRTSTASPSLIFGTCCPFSVRRRSRERPLLSIAAEPTLVPLINEV